MEANILQCCRYIWHIAAERQFNKEHRTSFVKKKVGSSFENDIYEFLRISYPAVRSFLFSPPRANILSDPSSATAQRLNTFSGYLAICHQVLFSFQ